MKFGIRSKARTVEFHLETGPGYYVEPAVMQALQQGSGYEPEVVAVLLRALRPGDLCVDVGANIGYFTAIMSQLTAPNGKVIAIEPDQRLVSTLKRIGFLNGGRVEVVESPLWKKSEEVTFWQNLDSAGGNSLWNPGLWWENPKTAENPNKKTMAAVTLDEICIDKDVRLIKIDCEGAEHAILEGGRDVLRFSRPYVIVELNRFGGEQLGTSGAAMRAYMADLGYDIFLLHQDGSLPTLVPRKTEITHYGGYCVMNALFSTPDDLGVLWPAAPEWRE